MDSAICSEELEEIWHIKQALQGSIQILHSWQNILLVYKAYSEKVKLFLFKVLWKIFNLQISKRNYSSFFSFRLICDCLEHTGLQTLLLYHFGHFCINYVRGPPKQTSCVYEHYELLVLQTKSTCLNTKVAQVIIQKLFCNLQSSKC